MLLNILKSKIHRVQVTEANLDYIGSITIDEALMEAANILCRRARAGSGQQQWRAAGDLCHPRQTRLGLYLHQRRRSALGECRRHGDHHGVRAHDAGRSKDLQARYRFPSE